MVSSCCECSHSGSYGLPRGNPIGRRLGLQKIVVEANSHSLVELCSSLRSIHAEVSQILADIEGFTKFFIGFNLYIVHTSSK